MTTNLASEGAAARAFVIQFTGDDSGAATGFSGRVEHVASGESRRFGSPEELTDFLARKLGHRAARAAEPK